MYWILTERSHTYSIYIGNKIELIFLPLNENKYPVQELKNWTQLLTLFITFEIL